MDRLSKFSLTKSLLILSTSIVVFMQFSCGLDCESKKIGSEDLLEDSKSYIPYTDGQSLVFVNKNMQELVLTAKRTETTSRLCTKILCKGFNDPFGTPPCEFFETTSINVELWNDAKTTVISLGVAIDLFEPESNLFFDALFTSYSNGSLFIEGRYGLEPHFTKPVFDTNKLSYASLMSPLEEALLNDRPYKSLLVAQSADGKIYIQPNKGIVAFETNGEIYTVKN